MGMKSIAIVTGATSGLGREFIRQLDGIYYGRIDEFWAVADEGAELAALAEATYAPLRALPLDLARDSSIVELRAALAAERNMRVAWLVNAAESRPFGPMAEAPAGALEEAVRLNCLALVNVIDAALPYMTAGSRIVNVASAAARLPLPGMGLYAATKGFALDVTRALNEELRDCGINACAVCPKQVGTEPRDAAGGFPFGGLLGAEKPYDVVRKAIAAVEHGRGSVVTSPDMAVLGALCKALPYGVVAGACKLLQGIGNPRGDSDAATSQL